MVVAEFTCLVLSTWGWYNAGGDGWLVGFDLG